MSKRIFDVMVSSIGLVLLAPLMAVIGILIKRDNEGPIFFRQERIGRNGQPFTLLKFRSMTVDATTKGPLVTATSDTRITKVGARLRTTKLDEFPQLVNVIRGDMSIVGPRPEVAQYVAIWTEEDRRIVLSVRPGITDPASLRFRRESEILAAQADPEEYYRDILIPQKLELYRNYVRTRSFGRDAMLLLSTLASIVKD